MGVFKKDVCCQALQAEAAIEAGLAECDQLIEDLQSLAGCAVLFRGQGGSMTSLDFTSSNAKRLTRHVSEAVQALRIAQQEIEGIRRPQ
jgi:hypothetical protein